MAPLKFAPLSPLPKCHTGESALAAIFALKKKPWPQYCGNVSRCDECSSVSQSIIDPPSPVLERLFYKLKL